MSVHTCWVLIMKIANALRESTPADATAAERAEAIMQLAKAAVADCPACGEVIL